MEVEYEVKTSIFYIFKWMNNDRKKKFMKMNQ